MVHHQKSTRQIFLLCAPHDPDMSVLCILAIVGYCAARCILSAYRSFSYSTPPLLVAGDFNSEATMTRIVPGLRNNARELQNNAQGDTGGNTGGDTGGTRTRVQHRPHITYVVRIHALSISRHDASHCCRASCHHPASQWHHASLFRFTLWQGIMPTACFTFTVASWRTPCRHYSSKLYTRGSCH